ncbi:hypothetical protein BH11ARM2_BH11ARM2_17360 [soil metagenome]
MTLAPISTLRSKGRNASNGFCGCTLDQYLADEGVREKVQWNLAILGEALVTLRKIAPEIAKRVNDLPGAIALRNFLIHVYHAIDDEKVWDTTVKDLPIIIDQLEGLLAELDEASGKKA